MTWEFITWEFITWEFITGNLLHLLGSQKRKPRKSAMNRLSRVGVEFLTNSLNQAISFHPEEGRCPDFTDSQPPLAPPSPSSSTVRSSKMLSTRPSLLRMVAPSVLPVRRSSTTCPPTVADHSFSRFQPRMEFAIRARPIHQAICDERRAAEACCGLSYHVTIDVFLRIKLSVFTRRSSALRIRSFHPEDKFCINIVFVDENVEGIA